MNEWIRKPGSFDKCIDFDKAIRNPIDTAQMHSDYSNDWLHPSAAGYQFLGESIDLDLFLGADTLFEQSGISKIESHYMEPECAEVGDNWHILNDVLASNEKYVIVKSGTQSLGEAPIDSASTIIIPFSIDSSGSFNLYARLNCPTYDDDSFWIKVDEEDFVMYNGLVTSGWQWLQLDTFNFTEGEHTITITFREDGAKLDKICISNDTVQPNSIGDAAENLCDSTATTIGNLMNVPDKFSLGQNYPNPFNPTTMISYAVPKLSNISLRIYNLLGEEVSILFDGIRQPGNYMVSMNAAELSSGVYIYIY